MAAEAMPSDAGSRVLLAGRKPSAINRDVVRVREVLVAADVDRGRDVPQLAEVK